VRVPAGSDREKTELLQPAELPERAAPPDAAPHLGPPAPPVITFFSIYQIGPIFLSHTVSYPFLP